MDTVAALASMFHKNNYYLGWNILHCTEMRLIYVTNICTTVTTAVRDSNSFMAALI